MNPLHEPQWLAFLRNHPNATERLFAALLEHAGPVLTAKWLDLLVTHGPRLGFPGFYTLYDVNTFALRYATLIEENLRVLPAAIQGSLVYMVAPPDDDGRTMTIGQVRRRTCRAIVASVVIYVRHFYPERFGFARTYEELQRKPPTPFL